MGTLKDKLASLDLTPEVIAAIVTERCRREPELSEMLRSDPRACLEELGKCKLPKTFSIVTHDNDDHTWHLPLPQYSQNEDVSEEQLQQIAAGEVWAMACIVGGVLAVGAVISVSLAAVTTKGFTR